MTIFGLNSPEIFLILVITLAILGIKRIEKGLDLLSRLLKFLLSNQSSIDKKAQKKESIEETHKKEDEITEIVEKPKVKELKKDDEITEIVEEPKVKELKKDDKESQEKEDKSKKRLKTTNIDKNTNNSVKIKDKKRIEKDKTGKKLETKNPKRIVKDKTVKKPNVIDLQEDQLEK